MIGTDAIKVSAFAPQAARPVRAESAVELLGPVATPVAFRDGFAYLHPAAGDIGILFCAPWGYEALCAHRSCVEFSAMLAAAGYPTLRFDYPGAANSASDLSAHDLDDWIDAAGEAAALLGRLSGVKQIVLAGFGLGCLVAAEAAARGLAVKGAILLAPPLTGRRYIRETQALAAMVAADDDGSEQIAPGDVAIAGFVMPAVFAAQTRRLDLARLNVAEGGFCIVSEKPDVDASDAVARLSANGAHVRECPLQGYAEIMAGPTMAVTPTAAFRDLIDVLRDVAPVRLSEAAPALQTCEGAAVVAGEGFVETAARFGEGDRLFGVLCRPATVTAERTPVVVMISVGRNSHVGWRRMSVENARSLARMGVASLRFDLAGIGDSAPRPGQPQQTLYSEWPALDAAEAIDYVTELGLGPVVLLGVCSGAYVGLQAAINDGRVAGLVAANIYRLVWDPSESVEQALRYGNRRIGPAVSRLLTRERMAKALAGKADLWPGFLHALKRIYRRIGVIAMRYLGSVGPRGALYAECKRRFEILRARNVTTTLCYSDGDDGLGEIDDYFGKDRAGLAAYPNVRLVGMARCDHNLTPPQASATMIAETMRVVHVAQNARR